MIVNMEYGYVRVSTKHQSLERQIRNIAAIAPKAKFYSEKYTGTEKEGRKEWAKLLKVVNPGDTIFFDSVSRMSRNAQEGFEDYQTLFERGVNLIFIKEPYINTDVYRQALSVKIPMTDTPVDIILDAVQRYVLEVARLQIVRAFEEAEKEVTDLRQRTREGMQTARNHGKQIGQQPGRKLVTKKSIEAKEKILKYSKDFHGGMDDKAVMDACRISPNTYYKYKRELRNESEGEMEG